MLSRCPSMKRICGDEGGGRGGCRGLLKKGNMQVLQVKNFMWCVLQSPAVAFSRNCNRTASRYM